MYFVLEIIGNSAYDMCVVDEIEDAKRIVTALYTYAAVKHTIVDYEIWDENMNIVYETNTVKQDDSERIPLRF